MGRGRKTSFFIHLETQYAKTDSKNEIYAKNWVRRTWIEKVNHGEKSTVWSAMTSADRWVTSADDVAVMMSPRANVSRRNLAHDSAWQSVMDLGGTWRILEACGGACSAWAFAQNLLAACEGAWQLWWWSGFHERVDRRRKILVVPAKTQSKQRSRRWRYGSGLETLNEGGCRSGTKDDDWNVSEV